MKSHNYKAEEEIQYVYRRELIVNDITRNVNRLRFIQILSKRLKEDAGTQVYNSRFIFIADRGSGSLTCKRKSQGIISGKEILHREGAATNHPTKIPYGMQRLCYLSNTTALLSVAGQL